ncbi:MAG: sodium-translocating pyrophosphatase [Candidatus Stygibacter australis]|nr:sodium-translocating pyrophosphatase [Candidatus Stygibacter australis]
MSIPIMWYIAPVSAVVALLFAWYFFNNVKKQDPGTERMQEIAGYVREGAFAYLKQQYKAVSIFFVIAFVVFNLMAHLLHVLHWLVPLAFLTGGFFSGLAGYIGMNTATMASNRTTAACRTSLNKGLQIAFRAGAVMGLVVVGLALIDISIWFFVLKKVNMELHTITVIMLSFGMGASTQALFARLGGGIFTKAADVGADLVGKVEAGIPEDDPRNPATIADNVGDNVGDVAGMGADLYESYCGSILATAALGMSAYLQAIKMKPEILPQAAMQMVTAPMILAGIGILLSIIGVFLVRSKENAGPKELMAALNKSVYGSSILIVIAAYFVTKFILPSDVISTTGVFFSVVIGLAAGILIGYFSERSTSDHYKPTKQIVEQSKYGPATVIIEGIAVGLESAAMPLIIIGIAIISAFTICGGFSEGIEFGLYGIGFGAVGMLATLGVTLATDAFGPIADNAGGNAEMSGLPPEVRKKTDALDSVGNTTAATGKGFAIGSAALTAMALMAAYLEEVRIGLQMQDIPDLVINYSDKLKETVPVATASIANFISYYEVNLMNPRFLVGIFLGTMAVFLFSSMTMRSVGKAAGVMVAEVRRQFKEIPGILEGKATPDYKRCVMISTVGAQKEMVAPAMVGIFTPVIVGVILGVAGVLGVLTGGLVAGFALACMMNNAGGAWDNAKKFIETGQKGGKGSDAHKACVVGDTVGDPFKDTTGPSINILIKLMSMVSIVFAGLIVAVSPHVQAWLGIVKQF